MYEFTKKDLEALKAWDNIGIVAKDNYCTKDKDRVVKAKFGNTKFFYLADGAMGVNTICQKALSLGRLCETGYNEHTGG